MSAEGRAYYLFSGSASKTWLLPTPRKLRRTALRMYTPYSFKGRLLKALMYLGVARRIHLQEDALQALECHLAETLGEPSVRLAFYNPVQADRCILLLMRPDGQLLAFGRMAGSPSARQTLAYERHILALLGGHDSLRPHVPASLAYIDHEPTSTLLISSGPETPGPAVWTDAHAEWVVKLHKIFAAPLPLRESPLWHRVNAVFTSDHLTDSWLERYRAAVRRLEPFLEVPVTMSLAHGDFAPWNTRVGDAGLFVFDWDYAREDYPPNYDYFHFHFMTASHLGGGVRPEQVANWLEGAPLHASVSPSVLFLAYLLDVAAFYHDYGDNPVLQTAASLLDAADLWFS